MLNIWRFDKGSQLPIAKATKMVFLKENIRKVTLWGVNRGFKAVPRSPLWSDKQKLSTTQKLLKIKLKEDKNGRCTVEVK